MNPLSNILLERYLIETPHTAQDCQLLVDQIYAMGYLYRCLLSRVRSTPPAEVSYILCFQAGVLPAPEYEGQEKASHKPAHMCHECHSTSVSSTGYGADTAEKLQDEPES